MPYNRKKSIFNVVLFSLLRTVSYWGKINWFFTRN